MIGKLVDVSGSGAGPAGLAAPGAVFPVTPRLCTEPVVPKTPVPVLPVTPVLPWPASGEPPLNAAAGAGAGAAPVLPLLPLERPDASTLAWARPNVMDVVAV